VIPSLLGRNVLLSIALLLVAGLLPAAAEQPLTLDAVKRAPAKVVPADAAEAPPEVKVVRDWSGSVCHTRIVNEGKKPVRIKEIVLFDLPHALPVETRLYGEGFTMLSQTHGTLGKPLDMGLTDRKHYKIPQPDDATTVYGLLTLHPPQGDHTLLAFASCRRFIGRFYVLPRSIQAVIDAEGLTLGAGQSWALEEFVFAAGGDRNALLTSLAERIAGNHPPLHREAVPTGWCSWYCFGSRVKAGQVLANLDTIARDVPSLRYIQLDDGYQPAMGDWLETGPGFNGGVRDVLRQIKQKGFEPALWVAPFIAEKDSRLFREHPDWFIRDGEGQPLSADRVTFKGWRRGPWYALDGTHPEVQKHLEELFRTLRRDWGCTYFKLDANFWGAMHGGKFHDPSATRIEAYRRGMQALLRGAGDAFVLGCNHPIWPSFGLVHGSRSSGDIKRVWRTFAGTARMNLSRNWQNGRLWWNDPDCAVFSGTLPEEEYLFHATVLCSSGGMVLSGDDLTKLDPKRLALLRKLLPPTGTAAVFDDESLGVGRIRLRDKELVCLLNWGEQPRTFSFELSGPCRLTDYWTGEALGRHEGTVEIKDVPKHSARLLVCERASR
jgi:alpha-galactosidase